MIELIIGIGILVGLAITLGCLLKEDFHGAMVVVIAYLVITVAIATAAGLIHRGINKIAGKATDTVEVTQQ